MMYVIKVMTSFLGIYFISILLAYYLHGAQSTLVRNDEPLKLLDKSFKWYTYFFAVSHKIRFKVNLDSVYDAYIINGHNKDDLNRLKARIEKIGHCKLDGENGAWEVWVDNYTYFGLPWVTTIAVCNDITF